MLKQKNFPDHTFEEAAQKAGKRVESLWKMKGPKDTAIEWIEMLLVDRRSLVCVHTYDEGWNLFTPANTINYQEMIDDALKRCEN